MDECKPLPLTAASVAALPARISATRRFRATSATARAAAVAAAAAALTSSL